MDTTTLSTAALRAIFSADHFAAHTGIEIVDSGDGWARTRLALQPHHLNGLGTVQGGAVFTLADLAFVVAANSHGVKVIGLNASINWVRTARGGALTAEAREASRSRRIATYQVSVSDDSGRLVATFHGTGYCLDEPWQTPAAASAAAPG